MADKTEITVEYRDGNKTITVRGVNGPQATAYILKGTLEELEKMEKELE